MQRACNDWLADWFERNPSEGKAIVTKASQAAKARKAAQQARNLSRKNALDTMGMPGKLQTAGRPIRPERALHRRGRLGRRLGPACRDSMFQAILPIRGKIINVEKSRIDRVLKNNEVQSLITALGTGIHDDFDLSKLRYHKIVLMADADVDGQHITTLLLTLAVPVHAPPDRGRPRVPRGAAAVQDQVVERRAGRPAYSDKERDGLVKADGKPVASSPRRTRSLGTRASAR